MRFCPLSSLRCVDRHQLSTFYSLLLLNSLHRENSAQLSSKTGFSHGYWGDMIASFTLHGWRSNDRTTSLIYTWYVVFACSRTIPMIPDNIEGKKKNDTWKKGESWNLTLKKQEVNPVVEPGHQGRLWHVQWMSAFPLFEKVRLTYMIWRSEYVY